MKPIMPFHKFLGVNAGKNRPSLPEKTEEQTQTHRLWSQTVLELSLSFNPTCFVTEPKLLAL